MIAQIVWGGVFYADARPHPGGQHFGSDPRAAWLRVSGAGNGERGRRTTPLRVISYFLDVSSISNVQYAPWGFHPSKAIMNKAILRNPPLPPRLSCEQDARLARESSRLLAACVGQGETARLRIIDGRQALTELSKQAQGMGMGY